MTNPHFFSDIRPLQYILTLTSAFDCRKKPEWQNSWPSVVSLDPLTLLELGNVASPALYCLYVDQLPVTFIRDSIMLIQELLMTNEHFDVKILPTHSCDCCF